MGISPYFAALRESRLLGRLLGLAVAIAVVVGLLTALIIGVVDSGHSAPAPTTAHAARVDSPAVVRILSLWQGQLVCVGCAGNGGDVVAPESGAFGFYAAGSGAFISPDGYIMTADHVLEHDTSNSEDVSLLLQTAAQDWANRYGYTANDWLQYFENHANSIQLNMQTTAGYAYLSTAYTGQLQNTAQVTSFKLQRVVASSPIQKQDVSIFKVEASDMPYLTLAPAASVNVGDAATAITFPADADYAVTGGDAAALLNPSQSDVNTINSLLSPSVQTGQVTATKKQPDGTPVYETSGIGAPGSSGGAFINTQGQIIGFDDAGPQTDRLNYLVPSSVIADYAHEANITPPSSAPFMSQWTSAIDDYDSTGACHFAHAASTLQQLSTQYQTFGAARPLLNAAQSQSGTNCPSPFGAALGAGLAAGLVALLAAAIYAFVMMSRQRVPIFTRVGGQTTGGYPPVGGPSNASGNASGNAPDWQPHAQPWAPPTPFQPPYAPLPPYEVPRGAAGSEQALSHPGTLPGQAGQLPNIQAPVQPAGLPQAPQREWNVSSPANPPAQWTQPSPAEPQQPVAAPLAGQPPAPLAGSGRMCSNGHVVADPSAGVCPICGAPLWQPSAQA